jgi:ketosteroid isomerase-like protein
MRVLYEALNRREVDVMLARCHPDVEMHVARSQAGLDMERVYRGRDGAARALETWLDAWVEYRMETHELIDLGDRVVVLSQQFGRGKESGAEVETPHATVITFEQGWAIRVELYWDWEEAEHAAPGGSQVDQQPRWLSLKWRRRSERLSALDLPQPSRFDEDLGAVAAAGDRGPGRTAPEAQAGPGAGADG